MVDDHTPSHTVWDTFRERNVTFTSTPIHVELFSSSDNFDYSMGSEIGQPFFKKIFCRAFHCCPIENI